MSVPFNLPTLTGDVLLGFSRFPPGIQSIPRCFGITLPPVTPQVELRGGGSVTQITLTGFGGTFTTTPTANPTGTIADDGSNIPAGALTLANVGGTHSTLRSWVELGTDGTIYYYFAVVGAQNEADEEFDFGASLTLGVTTSNVYNGNGDTILCGGVFSFPLQLGVRKQDLPFAVYPIKSSSQLGGSVAGGDACFFEFFVGDNVKAQYSIYQTYANPHEQVGDGYGCNFPESNLGQKITSVAGGAGDLQGYDSGLIIKTYEITSGGETYTGGVEITGTAARPGLYLAYVWCQSNAIAAPGSGGGGLIVSEFPAGDNATLIIISIRERGQLPGDPMAMIPHEVNATATTNLAVTHAEIDNTDSFADYIASITPGETWAYNAGMWSESTGYTHLAGYWSRTHYLRNSGGTIIATYSYVIVHDADKYWRLYCSADASTIIPWTLKAATPELGLDGEMPPKYWPSVHLCAKGGGACLIVPGNGVFDYAGQTTLGEATVDVLQQQPVHTPQYAGWSSLNFYPPEYQNNAGKLLYQHPEFGWVCVPAITTAITSENAAQYQVSPVPVTHIGVPFSPAAPPMVIGNNPEAIRRDLVLAGGGNGISVSNNCGAQEEWRAGGSKIALLGNMTAAGYFNGGIIWPHYPLTRMVNFERLRIIISASVSIGLSGNYTGVSGENENHLYWESDAGGTPSPPATPPAVYQGEYWSHDQRYYEERFVRSADGSCSATLELENVPCWYNGYMLLTDIRNIAASEIGSGTIEFAEGWQETGIQDNLYQKYDFDEHEWKTYQGNRGRYVILRDGRIGTLSADSCRMNIWLRGVIGFGREIDLCPSKVTNSDRPSAQIVFAGEMGVSAEWHFRGTCQGWEQKSIEDTREHWSSAAGGWISDTPAEDFSNPNSTLELSHSAGRSWASGLQVWHLGESNTLHGSYSGVRKSYSQSGSYEAGCSTEDEDGLVQVVYYYDGDASGYCELESNDGRISGRTAYDDIDSGDPDQVVRHPILYYDRNAYCTATTDDGTIERRYPGENIEHPTVIGASDAYAEYFELVQDCSVEAPARARIRNDGLYNDGTFTGNYSGNGRSENVELTITIQEN